MEYLSNKITRKVNDIWDLIKVNYFHFKNCLKKIPFLYFLLSKLKIIKNMLPDIIFKIVYLVLKFILFFYFKNKIWRQKNQEDGGLYFSERDNQFSNIDYFIFMIICIIKFTAAGRR